MAEPKTLLTDRALGEVDDRERALNQRRKVRDAFLATFGPPGKRTPHGEIMLEYLGKQCSRGAGRIKIAVDNGGSTDIPQTFFNAGQRDMLDLIYSAIEWRESDGHTSGGST